MRARPRYPRGEALRLMVYDRTCRGRRLLPGLTHAWWTGALIYGGLRRLDAWQGVRSWSEALAWLSRVGGGRPIAEVQFWGHGKWGLARVGREPLDREALARGHELHAGLRAVGERLVPGGRALWWFRTCETIGARRGQRFAGDLAEFLDARVAGHTHIIGPWQSGLHSLAPGERPGWSPAEGLREGDPDDPRAALSSSPRAPNTIHCLRGRVPEGY